MKPLIAYFSRKGNNYVSGKIIDLPVGNTEVAAKKIQALTDGDLFEIKTLHSYAEDYHKCTDEAKEELRLDTRPEIVGSDLDLGNYDTILLGFPNWWGTMPMGVYTFLESYDFTGKTIVPFCTHEGSGMGSSEQDIKKLCPGARIRQGLALRGGNVADSDHSIKNWLRDCEVI